MMKSRNFYLLCFFLNFVLKFDSGLLLKYKKVTTFPKKKTIPLIYVAKENRIHA